MSAGQASDAGGGPHLVVPLGVESERLADARLRLRDLGQLDLVGSEERVSGASRGQGLSTAPCPAQERPAPC